MPVKTLVSPKIKNAVDHVYDAILHENVVYQWDGKKSTIGLLNVGKEGKVLSQQFSDIVYDVVENVWNSIRNSMESATAEKPFEVTIAGEFPRSFLSGDEPFAKQPIRDAVQRSVRPLLRGMKLGEIVCSGLLEENRFEIRATLKVHVDPTEIPLAYPPKPGHDRKKRKEKEKVDAMTVEEEAALQAKRAKALSDVQAVLEETDAVRLQLLASVQDAVRSYVSLAPQGTIEEKRELALWLNTELGSRGYALQCPRSGSASRLTTDSGDHPEIGRFVFYHMESGQRRITSTRVLLAEPNILASTQVTGAKAESFADKEDTRSREREKGRKPHQ